MLTKLFCTITYFSSMTCHDVTWRDAWCGDVSQDEAVVDWRNPWQWLHEALGLHADAADRRRDALSRLQQGQRHHQGTWRRNARLCHRRYDQGRNFGLKSGDTNSEGERGDLGPEVRWEENGEKVFPPHPTLGSGRASLALPAGSGAQGTKAPMQMGNLAHFMHKRTLFINSSWGSNRSRGLSPPLPPGPSL